MPPVGQLHVDAILTDLSVQYRNEDMIWRFVMPELKVVKRSDKFWKYNKSDSFMLADDKIGPKSLPNEYDWGIATDNYSVKDHALGDWLPQEVIENADTPAQPEVDTNDFLNLLLDLAQENRVANVVFNPTSYDSNNVKTLSGTSQWGGAADDPIADILTAIESCYMRANVLVFGADTWIKLRKNPKIIDACKAVVGGVIRGGIASPSEVATLFEVEKILIGRSRYNAAKEGQTASYARLWGKHCAALHVAKKPGIKTITFGVTFSEMLRQAQRDFDPKRGSKGAHYIKVAWNSDEHVIANDVGYFIQNAVS